MFTLRDADVFPHRDPFAVSEWRRRLTVRLIIEDENGRIALVGTTKHPYFQLPGGGVEDGESVLDAVVRECREEVQCEYVEARELVSSQEYRGRDGKKYETHCFMGRKGRELTEDTRTENEKDLQLHVTWLAREQALALLHSQCEEVRSGKVEYYNTAFNILRDTYFLEEFCRLLFPAHSD